MNTETVTVSISGKAWNAEPIGADPHYQPQDEGLRAIKENAVVRRKGKGVQVILKGDADALLHLADWYEIDGQVWLSQCDPGPARAEGRECLKAAATIRAAVAKVQPKNPLACVD